MESLSGRSWVSQKEQQNMEKLCQKGHSGMNLCGSAQHSGIQHQRRTSDLQIDKWLCFRIHKETHPPRPLPTGLKNQSRLVTNANTFYWLSWLLVWYLQHFENSGSTNVANIIISRSSTSPVSKFLRVSKAVRPVGTHLKYDELCIF